MTQFALKTALQRGFGVLGCAAALTGAACAPRLENWAGEPVTRNYTGNYQKIAACTAGRLFASGTLARKTDFPSEKRINLWYGEGTATIWQADFYGDSPTTTKVVMPYPMTYGETHPDLIFRQVDICAGVIPPPNEPIPDAKGNYR